jgi:hypothetical protein
MEIHDDDQDRLIDMLLREELGGQRPPQMAERVLERAKCERWNIFKRIHPGWIAALVAAALVAVIVLPRFFSTPEEPKIAQPEPPKETPKEIPKAPEVAQKVHRTEKDEKTIVLGGFASVTLAPFTAIEDIKGDGDAQKIRLDQGTVWCEIEPNKGHFSVENPLGTVRVHGTKFKVTVNSEKHGEKTIHSRLNVDVSEGEVGFVMKEVDDLLLKAGEKGGSIVGTVTQREPSWLEIRADGEEKPIKYSAPWVKEFNGPDKHVMERIAKIQQGARVRMVWKLDEHERIIGVQKIEDGPKRELPRKEGDRKEPERKDGEHREQPRRDGENHEPVRPKSDEPRRDGDRPK